MLPVSGLAGSSFWASTESSATAPAITLAGARGGKWMSGRVFRTAPNDAIRQGSRRGLTSRNSPRESAVFARVQSTYAPPRNLSTVRCAASYGRAVDRTRPAAKNLPNKRANPASENGGAKLDHRAANRSCFWAE